MKLSYKQKLFLYFSIIFTVFTVVVVLFEQSREKLFKTEALEEKLEAYTEIVNAELINSDGNYVEHTESLLRLFPKNMRLSLIDKQGNVLFDNFIKDISSLDNHSQRPEITDAATTGEGSYIRTSISNNQEYLYYAKKFGNIYVRVALPYDIQTQRFLKPDNASLYYIVGIFVIMLIIINLATGRFSKSIKQLRDFAVNAGHDQRADILFPNDELGEIGRKIAENYHLLQESKQQADSQREKLFQHVQSSGEGICFFSKESKVEFYNGLFIQYLNTINDELSADPMAILSNITSGGINSFISESKDNYFETQIDKQGKTFSLRLNRFDDKSFEVIINDITKHERTRMLKQEMTGNIAHELRTPVTSIRGYLETVLEQPVSDEQKQHFITKAYHSTIVLSELIRDMGLITKMEEAPQSFATESVCLDELLRQLKNDLKTALSERNIEMKWQIAPDLKIMGNRNLLYSIFRNLSDNAIRYAGDGVTINISQYDENKDFCYFSFYDTGIGITDEKHLRRLFERFYRINEGRTRDTGGSGLGLSIVKNAVAFHKGNITVKNRKEGGLEFLFNLHK